MAAPPQDLSRLTRSARTAMAWAALRAAERAPSPSNMMSKQAYSAPPAVTVPDLLTGILLTHPGTAEPAELLRHAGVAEERLYVLLEPTGFTPVGRTGGPPGLGDAFDLDPDADSAFRTAMDLSARLNPEKDGLLRLRDLFGGLLLGSSEGPALFNAVLEGSPLSLQAVASMYPEFLERDSSASFSDFLRERFPIAAVENVDQFVTPTHNLRRVAVLDADRPGKDDWVGIGAEVDALAYLMTAPALQPPLAVGLFGDWGSGKSFFMESLRRRIDKLTEAARDSPRPQRELPVFRNISQIEFNAWHYVEGNLWASLVEHIFQTLAGGSPDDSIGVEERMRGWTLELESQQVALADVDARLTRLRQEQGERAQALEDTRQIRQAKLEALKQTRARDLLEAVTLQPEVRQRIDRLLADVGLVSVNASAIEARDALVDARGVLQHGNALLTPLRQRGSAGWLWALALVGVALSGPAVAWALAWLPARFPALGGVSLDGVTRTFTGIAAFLSTAAVLLRRGSGWMSASLNRVEDANARLEEIRAERAQEVAREEAALQHQLDVLDDEVGRLADRKAEIDAKIALIRSQLQSLTPTRLLSDFIDDRVDSEDYRKHLGVPALIRRDFRKLSTYIQKQNAALMTGDEMPDATGPAVNRVILYIDDLDRCPPQRVVEVLQAVHLLLAFELFVVVVAVDSRWLSRSLLTHYEKLLGVHGGNGTGDSDHATPDNYLEKIFQIPFHVRPLTDGAQHRILLGLLGPLADGDGAKSGNGAAPAAGGMTATNSGDADAAVAAGGGAASHSEGGGDAHSSAASPGSAETADAPPNANFPPDEPPDLTVDRMRIRSGELAFMESLRPLLGRTPRSMKRFVNVYRLLTAIADGRDLDFYVEPNDPPAEGGPEDGPEHASADAPGSAPAPAEPPPYQIAMFLLAVVTGLPGIAPDILHPIEIGAAAIRRKERKREEITLGWVLQRFAAGGLVLRPEGPSPEYRRLKSWLETHDGGAWSNLPLDHVAPWVDLVSRFSFRSEVGIEP
ncbi:MAG TPA: P-loop NTPase fold protein [Longimicrobiaceae bacterium]|nr:P-loop NTPase fold protein [Longimicrobiaceae bacterium]